MGREVWIANSERYCGKVLEINGLPQPDIVVVTNRIVHERGGIGIEGKDPGRPYMGQVTIFGNLIKLGASGSRGARNRPGAGETLPHRGANWTNPATSGHNQRPESLDFLGSPKGSNPFCSIFFNRKQRVFLDSYQVI